MTIMKIIVPVVLLQASCMGHSGNRVDRDEAVSIANEHFVEVLPQVPLRLLVVEVLDRNDDWMINYYPPEGSTGNGPFRITVRKRDGRILEGLVGDNAARNPGNTILPESGEMALDELDNAARK
jgi:hypothetical protein